MHKIMFNDRYGLTQAVIESRKTMTRRLINLNSTSDVPVRIFAGYVQIIGRSGNVCAEKKLPYKVGEVVAVAQSYKTLLEQEGVPFEKLCVGIGANDIRWYNKMFVRADLMPHQIRITGIRIERLQDISDEDCMKEGIMRTPLEMRCAFYFCNNECLYDSPLEAFAALIDKVSGKGTWARNPWVAVYEFELVKSQNLEKLK